MLKGIYTSIGGEFEPVTVIQFIGTPAHAVFLRSDGTLAEAEISCLSNVHEELVSSVSKISPLTHRQRDVLRYLSKGYSNSLIAKALGIGKQTVKTHIRGILFKLAVSNRTQAVSKSIENNLL